MDTVEKSLRALMDAVEPYLPTYAGPPLPPGRALSDLLHAYNYAEIALSQVSDAP